MSLNSFLNDNSSNNNIFEAQLIATIPISLKINVKIFQGSHGKYYKVVDLGKEDEEDLLPIYYDIHFPLSWVFDEEFKMYSCSKNMNVDSFTGPLHCNNCKYFGYYNGVFIGYCMNCAEEFCNGRGNGLTDKEGVEINEEMVAFDLTYFSKEKSIWNTYLKGVSLNEIGDVTLKEEFELYKDLPDLIPIKEEEEELDDLEKGYFKPIRVLTREEEEEYEDSWSYDSREEREAYQMDKLMEDFGDRFLKSIFSL